MNRINFYFVRDINKKFLYIKLISILLFCFNYLYIKILLKIIKFYYKIIIIINLYGK